MNAQAVSERLKRAANVGVEDRSADSLIGIFQAFRPDGLALAGIFDDVEGGEEFAHRLGQVYDATGDARRPDAMRDAYFIVRRPAPIAADLAGGYAMEFFLNLATLARHLGSDQLTSVLERKPQMRVLEGKPPKHPKAAAERAQLLKAIEQEGATLTEAFTAEDSVAAILRPACYFIACDPFLRDYVLWPLLKKGSRELGDPFAPYFDLWRHGVKYRIFQEDQIDIYLPTRSTGMLVDAGRFSPESS